MSRIGSHGDMRLGNYGGSIAGIARAEMTTGSLPDDQTKVGWSTVSTMKYPLNIMLLVIEKMLEKDIAISLTALKNALEK